MGEVGIGLRPSTIPPITQMTKLYCYVYMLLLVVFKTFHGDERSDRSGDIGRRQFRSQDTRHSYFHDTGEGVEYDGRG